MLRSVRRHGRRTIAGSSADNADSRRSHFNNYLSDWETYGFQKALAKPPRFQEATGNYEYVEDIPIFGAPNGTYLGTQEFTVIVDWRPLPAQIKTAWGNPEDIRDITHRYYKLDGWIQPDDWANVLGF